MTEKLEPDEKTIASLNASLEKCWNDAENPLPYIPLVVPPIEVPEFNFFGNGKEWHTEKKDEYTTPATPASTPRDTLQADGADELDFIMGQSLNNMMMEEQRKPVLVTIRLTFLLPFFLYRPLVFSRLFHFHTQSSIEAVAL